MIWPKHRGIPAATPTPILFARLSPIRRMFPTSCSSPAISGRRPKKAHERLYLSPDLSSYVEIPRDGHPASGGDAERAGRAWRRHALGEEGRGAAIQDGARGASAGELFRRGDPGGGAGRAGGGAAGRTSCHGRSVRPVATACQPSIARSIARRKSRLASTRTRVTCYCPVTAWLPDAGSALPVAGRLHLDRLRSFACVYIWIALRGRRSRRRPAAASVNCTAQMRDGITPCANTHANTWYVRSARRPTQNQLCVSQGCTWIGCGATAACTMICRDCGWRPSLRDCTLSGETGITQVNIHANWNLHCGHRGCPDAARPGQCTYIGCGISHVYVRLLV